MQAGVEQEVETRQFCEMDEVPGAARSANEISRVARRGSWS